jgi:transcriptional regulator with XRE-family HTH domain
MTAMPRASQILLVGQRIRQLRKSRHLTQADLASRIGIAQSDLSRMENGEYKVGLDTLFRILQVFELSMSSFFEEAAPEIDDSALHSEILSEIHSGSEGSGMAGTRAGVVRSTLKDERDQLVSDWTELSEESRREVREFISFKRMQAESRRPLEQPKWKPESAELTDDSGEHVSLDSGSAPDAASPATTASPKSALASERDSRGHDGDA